MRPALKMFMALVAAGFAPTFALAQESAAFSAFEKLCERDLTNVASAREYFEANGWTEAEGDLRKAGALVGGFTETALEIWVRDDGESFELATVAEGAFKPAGSDAYNVPFYCRLFHYPADEKQVIEAMTAARGAPFRREDATQVGAQYLWGPRGKGTAHVVQTEVSDATYVYISKMVMN